MKSHHRNPSPPRKQAPHKFSVSMSSATTNCQEKEIQPTARIFIVGVGNRGRVYSRYGLERPDLCTVVGFAEPRQRVTDRLRQEFSGSAELESRFLKRVDAVVICLQDREHYEACIWFANLKCHILLEKPMALTVRECQGIYEAVTRNDILFAVCHVLRYSEITQKVKSIVQEGGIGKIMHIHHLEPVGYYVCEDGVVTELSLFVQIVVLLLVACCFVSVDLA